VVINNENTNNSQKLLDKCIQMIKQIVTSDANPGEKHNIIKKCLRVLKIMIEESEKKGTARVKSHFGLQKRKIMKFKVTSQTHRVDDCHVKVYGNTTMWDLKEIVANKSKVCVDFIKLQIGKDELSNTDHGKTVIDMKVTLLITYYILYELSYLIFY